jgi:uncharacterized protein (DUF305 family)
MREKTLAADSADRNVRVVWWPPIWIVGGLLLILMLNWLLHLWTQHLTFGTNSPDVTFARDMAAHHEQAVEMALIIRERSDDTELRSLALDMVLTQQAQIGQMQGWLAAWDVPLSGEAPPMAGHGPMMGMANQEQVRSLALLPTHEAEIGFLQLMIRHHQGGVRMAQEALEQARRPEVRRLATAIVAGQQSEIDTMVEALRQRGARPLPPLEHR